MTTPPSAPLVKIGPRAFTTTPPWSQRCTSCTQYADYDDIKALHYRRSDAVPGQSYPLCGRCRPEKIRRLERMGFSDIEARPTPTSNAQGGAS